MKNQKYFEFKLEDGTKKIVVAENTFMAKNCFSASQGLNIDPREVSKEELRSAKVNTSEGVETLIQFIKRKYMNQQMPFLVEN